MTTKERIALMVWCQNAVIAVKFQEAAIQIQQQDISKDKSAESAEGLIYLRNLQNLFGPPFFHVSA